MNSIDAQHHIDTARAKLRRSEEADQSVAGFGLSRKLCAEAMVHLELAKLGEPNGR